MIRMTKTAEPQRHVRFIAMRHFDVNHGVTDIAAIFFGFDAAPLSPALRIVESLSTTTSGAGCPRRGHQLGTPV